MSKKQMIRRRGVERRIVCAAVSSMLPVAALAGGAGRQ